MYSLDEIALIFHHVKNITEFNIVVEIIDTYKKSFSIVNLKIIEQIISNKYKKL